MKHLLSISPDLGLLLWNIISTVALIAIIYLVVVLVRRSNRKTV